LSFSHSLHSGLLPIPRKMFSGLMLLPVWQLGLLWYTSELAECHAVWPLRRPVVSLS